MTDMEGWLSQGPGEDQAKDESGRASRSGREID